MPCEPIDARVHDRSAAPVRLARAVPAPPLVLAALCAALALPQAPAGACGPDFPIELLADRPRTMDELPEGVFVEEVAHLVPPPGRYAVVASGEVPPDPAPGPGARELALYQRGAAAFRRGDRDAARTAFRAVLALPAAERHHRSTWAAYMLGRLDPGTAGDVYFPMVRALVDDGFADVQGLAAASFGEQALGHDDLGAIHLYAQQAALGDPSGATSLLYVVRALVAAGREHVVLGDPLGQRLVAAYLYTRDGELSDAQRDRVWRALAAVPHPAGADRLAAAAYRAGRWDDAARLVAGADDTAVGRWVRAKLALRAGDRAAAARFLDGAAAAYEAAPPAGDAALVMYAGAPRVHAERAILALAEGQYPTALAHAWQARTLYRDAIYVAERIATIEELRAFVDGLEGGDSDPDPDSDSGYYTVVDRASLRSLLARRLLRAGRFAEAIPYLPAEHRDTAITYATAIAVAHATPDRLAQAAALYRASRVARTDGLAILGTEHGPDWATWGADYDLAVEHTIGPWYAPAEPARVAASAPAERERFHYRFVASRLAEAAADRLPHQSQAFAATLCWAARHVRYRDDERVRRLYHRYTALGPAAVDMAFGDDCPEPEIERARRFLHTPPARPRWHRALPVAAALAVASTLALLVLSRRRTRRFAARP